MYIGRVQIIECVKSAYKVCKASALSPCGRVERARTQALGKGPGWAATLPCPLAHTHTHARTKYTQADMYTHAHASPLTMHHLLLIMHLLENWWRVGLSGPGFALPSSHWQAETSGSGDKVLETPRTRPRTHHVDAALAAPSQQVLVVSLEVIFRPGASASAAGPADPLHFWRGARRRGLNARVFFRFPGAAAWVFLVKKVWSTPRT